MAKKGNDEPRQFEIVDELSTWYLDMDKVEEALHLHKRLCTDIGRELIDPCYMIRLLAFLHKHHLHWGAIKIIEEHLDIINESWDTSFQRTGYCTLMHDFKKTSLYGEIFLSLTKEAQNPSLESGALLVLGMNCGSLGDYKNALKYLEQSLAIEISIGRESDVFRVNIYLCMGGVLIAMGGFEKEAIEVHEKACALYSETTNKKEAMWSETFRKLAEAHREIWSWDDAISALNHSVTIAQSIEDEQVSIHCQGMAYKTLGQTYLEQYCADESLADSHEILCCAYNSSMTAVQLLKRDCHDDNVLLLDLAQEQYFLGGVENAQVFLEDYLDTIISSSPLLCEACDQKSGTGAIMQICGGCNVAHYCSRSHQKQSWKKGRICHKDICPLLNRWRRVKKGKDNSESCKPLFREFFESIYVAKPAGARLDADDVNEEYDSETEE